MFQCSSSASSVPLSLQLLRTVLFQRDGCAAQPSGNVQSTGWIASGTSCRSLPASPEASHPKATVCRARDEHLLVSNKLNGMAILLYGNTVADSPILQLISKADRRPRFSHAPKYTSTTSQWSLLLGRIIQTTTLDRRWRTLSSSFRPHCSSHHVANQ